MFQIIKGELIIDYKNEIIDYFIRVFIFFAKKIRFDKTIFDISNQFTYYWTTRMEIVIALHLAKVI